MELLGIILSAIAAITAAAITIVSCDDARKSTVLWRCWGLRNSIKTIIYMSQSIYYLHLYGSINIGFALLTKNYNLI